MSPIGGVIWTHQGISMHHKRRWGSTVRWRRGGLPGCGAVFELSPNADGSWTETLLYAFTINFWDGTYPYSGLVFDKSGNLYGTTFEAVA